MLLLITLFVSSLPLSVSAKTNPNAGVNKKFGYVEGKVIVGPLCGIVMPGQTCPASEEVYTSRNVVIYGANGIKVNKIKALNPDGSYRIRLRPGTYWVQILTNNINPRIRVRNSGEPQIIPMGISEKKKVVIEARKTVGLNFNVDTGIR